MIHCIFDTETTALVANSLQPLHKQPQVIEFFGVLLDDRDWSEVQTLHSFLDPEKPIPAEVTRITGLKDEDVKGKPKFADFAPSLIRFIESADRIAAHNLSYDKSVINFELKRILGVMRWPPGVCTVEATEHIKGHRLNLTALHTELFGEGFEKAHSAENDVRATARCYIELHKRGEI